MKVRAAVLHEIGAPAPYAQSRPLTIETVDLDPPGEGEVLISIKAAGLCHSDLSVINGARPRPVPMVLGHEASGIVTGIGPGIDDLAVGDHVVLVFVPSCGHCVPCAEGRPALCEPGAAANTQGTLITGARRLHLKGNDIHHHLGVSAFADQAVVSRNSVVKINKHISFEDAALFGCAVITGVGAVLNTARVKGGESVAVIGLGGVGLNALLGARLAGACKIIAIDLLDKKLVLAQELGATHVINAREPGCAEHVRHITQGGVDHAFEMSGSIPALELAWEITRRGGETITAGLPHPGKRLAIPPVQLVGEERTLRGSYLGSCVPVRDIPSYIDLFQSNRLPVEKLKSDYIRIEHINEAFDKLSAGEAIRQIIVF